jgi:hypothetical protein
MNIENDTNTLLVRAENRWNTVVNEKLVCGCRKLRF